MHPHSVRATALLNKLTEMDDQILNTAQPVPPSDVLVDALKTELVELIQYYAQDPAMIDFWTPSESDLRPELPQRSNSGENAFF